MDLNDYNYKGLVIDSNFGLPGHNFGHRSTGSRVTEHELDLALDSRLLGHLGVVDEGLALLAAGGDVTSGHVLQTF